MGTDSNQRTIIRTGAERRLTPNLEAVPDETHEVLGRLDFDAGDEEALDDQRFGKEWALLLVRKEALQHGRTAVMMRAQSRRTKIAASSRETFLSTIYLVSASNSSWM